MIRERMRETRVREGKVEVLVVVEWVEGRAQIEAWREGPAWHIQEARRRLEWWEGVMRVEGGEIGWAGSQRILKAMLGRGDPWDLLPLHCPSQ